MASKSTPGAHAPVRNTPFNLQARSGVAIGVTPAWRAIPWTCHRATTVVVDDPSVLSGKRIIAECETEDVARMVAATRYLLLACQGLLECVETGITSLGTMRLARKAIAQAEGSVSHV